MRAPVNSLQLAALVAILAVASAAAQDDTALRAPRLAPRGAAPVSAPAAVSAAGDAAAAIGRRVLRPPSATRLAPLPEERGAAPEEIIVIGAGWRLPDLGSRWREQQAEAAQSGRFQATALPLYDPSRPPLHGDGFWLGPEAQRQGYIELFRLRFGRRDSND